MMYKRVMIPLMLVLLQNLSDLRAQIIVQTYSYTGTSVNFTVPLLCVPTITIEAIGAGGGSISTSCSATGGLGASILGVFTVTNGQVLNIRVGQAGQSNNADGGGGGGSFVATGTVPLIIGGGGGGATNNALNCGNNRNGLNATITTTGSASGSGSAAGGTNGNGGSFAGTGGGGAGGGFYTNGGSSGSSIAAGQSWLNGSAGGTSSSGAHGGYGGGGAGWSTGAQGGGGGGYSGGGSHGASPYTGGGGGGSFNSGSNQINTASVSAGHGSVFISYNIPTPITFTASPASLCTGATVTLTASSMNSYTWLPVGTFTGSNSQTITHNPTSTTVYTAQGTNSLGCVSTTIITVPVFQSVPSLTVVNTASATGGICPGKSVTLTASGATTYTWTGATTVTNGIGFAPTVPSVYTVTGQNACGINTAATSVSIHSLPTVSTTVSQPTVCSGTTVTAFASGNATAYTWSPFIANGVPFYPIASNYYTVTGTSAFGCTATSVVYVGVVTTPIAIPIASSYTICLGNSSTLTATGASNYTWTTPSGTFYTAVISVTPNASSVYTVTKSNSNCFSTQTVQVIVSNSQVSGIASPSFVCASHTLQLQATGAQNYTWTGPSFTSTVANPIISPSISAIYTLTGSSGSCMNTATVAVSVQTTVAMNILTSNPLICEGAASNLTVTGANSYQWDANAGNSTGSIVSVNPLATTIYTVTGYFSSNNCSSTKTIQISVFAPIISVNSPTSTCVGGTINLMAVGAFTYTWNNNQSGSLIAVSPSQSTVYIVSATSVSMGVNCVSNHSVTVMVYNNPTVTASAQKTLICLGESVNLIAGGAYFYNWSTNNTGSVVGVSPQNNTTYTLQGTDQNGCIGTGSIIINVALCTGLLEPKKGENTISIFPNPTCGQLTVKSIVTVTLTLSNELGQVIGKIQLSAENNYQTEIKNLATGIYFLKGSGVSEKISVTR